MQFEKCKMYSPGKIPGEYLVNKPDEKPGINYLRAAIQRRVKFTAFLQCKFRCYNL